MDSSWMIQKYTDLVVFQVDSIWTPGGVQLEYVGECKVHVEMMI